MTENDDLKKEPNRETEAALEAVANQDVARFTNVGSLLADLNDELIKQATARAAILHASAAWGSDEDGHLIDRMIARIEELESWKAAEEAHHLLRAEKVDDILRAENERLREAMDAIRKTMDSYRSQMKFCDIEALAYFREFDRRIEQSGFRAALGETQ